MEVNSYIRNNLIRTKKILTKGDILTSNTNTYDEYQSLLLTNSSDYKVLSVEYIESDYGFNIYVCDLLDSITGKLINAVRIVDHLDSKSWNMYKQILLTFYNTAINSDSRNRGKNWRAYYQFKSNYLQMIKFNVTKHNIVDRDIQYGYANTVYKAQGSTYDISYINMKELVLTKDNNFKKNNYYNKFAVELANNKA